MATLAQWLGKRLICQEGGGTQFDSRLVWIVVLPLNIRKSKVWGSVWGHFGISLGWSWYRFRTLCVSCWDRLGMVLGSCRGRLGIAFPPFGDLPGIVLGSFLARVSFFCVCACMGGLTPIGRFWGALYFLLLGGPLPTRSGQHLGYCTVQWERSGAWSSLRFFCITRPGADTSEG